MTVHSPVKKTRSWASDLVQPLPLFAVGVLALNDHVLKGSGALPGAVTGKLSDIAGLFFFPLFLSTLLRGGSLLMRRRDIADRRSLAVGTALATMTFFAAVKLIPSVNALVASTWGVMVMDPTDLAALPMSLLAATWMLRPAPATSTPPPESRSRSDFRRARDLAAVAFAAIATIATSKKAEPPPPPPPQPVAQAVAEDPSCASLSIDTCERTATQTLVVVRARSDNGDTCTIDVLRAEEAADGAHTPADVLPKNVVVSGNQSRTFALTFLRNVPPTARGASLRARAELRMKMPNGSAFNEEIELSGGCLAR